MSKCAKGTKKMIPYSCKNRYKTGEQKIFPDKLEKDKSGYSHNRISGGMDRSDKDKDKDKESREGFDFGRGHCAKGGRSTQPYFC
jgi:hypothetical protein